MSQPAPISQREGLVWLTVGTIGMFIIRNQRRRHNRRRQDFNNGPFTG